MRISDWSSDVCSSDLLGGQPFLHLEPARIAVEDACEFRNADDAVLRQIGDRRLAGDRRHMMFAVRLERNIAQQHDLVIAADLFESAGQMNRRVLAIAVAIFLQIGRASLWERVFLYV